MEGDSTAGWKESNSSTIDGIMYLNSYSSATKIRLTPRPAYVTYYIFFNHVQIFVTDHKIQDLKTIQLIKLNDALEKKRLFNARRRKVAA